jgi:hypothetical protein
VKVAAVKCIYAELGLEEEAKQEIIRLHGLAMDSVAALNLAPEAAQLLKDYAAKLIGRTK